MPKQNNELLYNQVLESLKFKFTQNSDILSIRENIDGSFSIFLTDEIDINIFTSEYLQVIAKLSISNSEENGPLYIFADLLPHKINVSEKNKIIFLKILPILAEALSIIKEWKQVTDPTQNPKHDYDVDGHTIKGVNSKKSMNFLQTTIDGVKNTIKKEDN